MGKPFLGVDWESINRGADSSTKSWAKIQERLTRDALDPILASIPKPGAPRPPGIPEEDMERLRKATSKIHPDYGRYGKK